MELNTSQNASSNTSLSRNLQTNITVFTAIFSIQFIFAVIFNTLIPWIIHKDKRLKTTTNFLVANMAVSDLMASTSVFPIRIAWINFDNKWFIGGAFGRFVCKLSPYIAEVSLAVSVYCCFFIALDRYFAVAHPIKKPLQANIKLIIASTWILSILLKIPTLYYFDIVLVGDKPTCNVSNALFPSFILYFYIINIITFGLSIIVVTVMYILIVYKLHQRKVPGIQTDTTIKRKDLQNKKVLRMSVTIVGLFYLTWGTRSIIAILNDTGKLDHLSYEADYNLITASYAILFMSLVYNFLVYLTFNSVYRQNVKNILTKCHLKIQSLQDYSFGKSVKEEEAGSETVVKMKDVREICEGKSAS